MFNCNLVHFRGTGLTTEHAYSIWFNLLLLLLFSAVKRYDALAALGAAGMVDIQNLVKWIGKL